MVYSNLHLVKLLRNRKSKEGGGEVLRSAIVNVWCTQIYVRPSFNEIVKSDNCKRMVYSNLRAGRLRRNRKLVVLLAKSSLKYFKH